MNDFKIGSAGAHFADLIWENEPITSGQLAKLGEEKFEWKKTTSFTVLKRLGNSEMMRRSFADYDINKFKSKSLDWVMTKLVLKKHYFAAHLLCKHVLYK